MSQQPAPSQRQIPSRCLFVLVKGKAQRPSPATTEAILDINALYKTISSTPISLKLSHKPLSASKLHIWSTDPVQQPPQTGNTTQQQQQQQQPKRKHLYVLTHENLRPRLDKSVSDYAWISPSQPAGTIPEDQKFQFYSKGQCVESTFSDMHAENDEHDLTKVENHYLLRLSRRLGYSWKRTISFQFYHAKQESFDIRLARLSPVKYVLDIRYEASTMGLTDDFWKDVVDRIVVQGWNVQGPPVSELHSPMLILQYVSLIGKNA